MGARTRFRLFGREVPAALYPAPRRQWSDPESVLGRLEGALPPPAPLHPCFCAEGLFNGQVYLMRRIRLRPALQIDCRPGWYFDSMNTCEKLEREGRFLAAPPPPALWRNGAGRSAAVGISTVVAWRESDQWMALAGRVKAKSMPQRAGRIHVAPSGMFAPPYSITANVRRELEEETGLGLPPGALRLTGVAVNLRNLRPEICTLLVVERPPEALSAAEFDPTPLRVPVPVRAREAAPAWLAETEFTPPAAAALLLAARLLRAL
ncbi:MAG: hypothetical protein NZR01_00445 [Bryobacteraceae bacterium]|nr:hypothetical protein [Bryobacteraceae bacterium]